MSPPDHPEKRSAGRTLPATAEDFGDCRLNEPSKLLILELLTLVQERYSTVTAMIKDAMASSTSSDRPPWAVGSPDAPTHVRKAKSTVSKFLGRSAQRCPAWPTVAWIVRTCAPHQGQTELTAVMAGRWCAATGIERPPGYTGAIRHGEQVLPELIDPDLAPDDTTRARLLEDQVATLQAAVRQRDDMLTQRDATISQLATELATTQRQLQTAQITSDATQQRQALTAELDDVRTQLRRSREHNQVLWECLQQTAHYLGITMAYLLTRRLPPHPYTLLTIPSLKEDPLLARLLTPTSDGSTQPRARWLAAYLNTVLRIGHPRSTTGGIPTTLYQTKAGEHLNEVLAGRRPPSSELIEEIIRRFPIAAEILRNITLVDDTPTVPLPPLSSGPVDGQRTIVTVQELINRAHTGTPPIVSRTGRQQIIRDLVARLRANTPKDTPGDKPSDEPNGKRRRQRRQHN